MRESTAVITKLIQSIDKFNRSTGLGAIAADLQQGSALADALKGKRSTPGGEGDGQHEEIALVTVPPVATVPVTDERILAYAAKLER